MAKYSLSLANCFNRAANSYDNAAVLQQQVGIKLIELLGEQVIDPYVIADVGGGTGYLAQLLRQRYPQARILLTDLAYRMLTVARAKLSDAAIYTMQADFSALPFVDNSVDVVFASMSLHWSLNLTKTLSALKRVLKPGGILVFSLPAAGTFYELITSIKSLHQDAMTNEFYSLADIKCCVNAAEFRQYKYYTDDHCEYYTDFRQLLSQLKQTGINHVKFRRGHHYVGKQYFSKLALHYETYRQAQGLPLTYKIIYGLLQL